MGSRSTFDDLRICVIDDNRNFQNLFRTLLRGMGIRRVDLFGDPIEARSFVRDTPVDLTFVDLVMPRQNGIEWVTEIRRSTLPANPTMPIALVSGHVDRKVIDAAIIAGVDDVMVKPLSPSTLHRHTMRLLKRPHRYVRGPNGYFGPDLRGTITGTTEKIEPVVSHQEAPKKVPALHHPTNPGVRAAIRRDPVSPPRPPADQTFLD